MFQNYHHIKVVTIRLRPLTGTLCQSFKLLETNNNTYLEYGSVISWLLIMTDHLSIAVRNLSCSKPDPTVQCTQITDLKATLTFSKFAVTAIFQQLPCSLKPGLHFRQKRSLKSIWWYKLHCQSLAEWYNWLTLHKDRQNLNYDAATPARDITAWTKLDIWLTTATAMQKKIAV